MAGTKLTALAKNIERVRREVLVEVKEAHQGRRDVVSEDCAVVRVAIVSSGEGAQAHAGRLIDEEKM